MATNGERISTVWVRTATARYPVWIGDGVLLHSARRLASIRPDGSCVFVISSPRVWRAWGRDTLRGLARSGFHTEVLLFPDREDAKHIATVERLARELVRRGADRSALLVAVGGGVVGDVVGFLAATYLRGVEYVQVPTTLVGQIDSALGGKTGINLPEGKNLLGAFHHPRAVLADPCTLSTLPAREFRSGLYEAVKYGVIGDAALFRFLERRLADIMARNPRALRFVIERCARLKACVVARDEREQGLRQILNFGHTVGHALEALGGYRQLRHGEAVGWGMMVATLLAVRLGRLRVTEGERILRLVHALGPLPAWPRVNEKRIYSLMLVDKKARAGELRFVLPRAVGQVDFGVVVPRRELLACLRACRTMR
jgi:3-dehydroquinate synthase